MRFRFFKNRTAQARFAWWPKRMRNGHASEGGEP